MFWVPKCVFFLQKGSVLNQALFPQDDGPLGTWLNSQVMCLDSKDQSMGISQGHKASIKIFITHHHEPSIRRPAISWQEMWHLRGVDAPLRISPIKWSRVDWVTPLRWLVSLLRHHVLPSSSVTW